MPKRKLKLSINSHATMIFYRSVCLECQWSGKEWTVQTMAMREAVAHHRRNPDHWVTVRQTRPVHQFKPEENYLPGMAPELDKPPF